MSIPASAQPDPIVAPSPGLPFTDAKGNLTNNARIALQQMHDYIVNINRTIPCNASTALNVITLTLLPAQPDVTQYADYETFSFVADATSTGNVSAKVATETGTLATLKVYKTNGSAQAGAGDVTSGLHYMATYVDSLDSGNGGLVLR